MAEWAWAVGGLVVAFMLSLALNRFERTSTGKRLSAWIERRREAQFRVRTGWWVVWTDAQYTRECLATHFQWTVANLTLPEDHPSFKLAAEDANDEDIEFARNYMRRANARDTVSVCLWRRARE
jgi:hypothetical protein